MAHTLWICHRRRSVQAPGTRERRYHRNRSSRPRKTGALLATRAAHDELKETTTTEIVLAESFDDDDYRLHRGRSRVQRLICQDHHAIVLAECLELRTGTVFELGQSPTIERNHQKRRNQTEKKRLLSHVRLETERGQQELQ